MWRIDPLPRTYARPPLPVAFTERERAIHSRRSPTMTVMTLAMGLALFAAFFGLVAACDRL